MRLAPNRLLGVPRQSRKGDPGPAHWLGARLSSRSLPPRRRQQMWGHLPGGDGLSVRGAAALASARCADGQNPLGPLPRRGREGGGLDCFCACQRAPTAIRRDQPQGA